MQCDKNVDCGKRYFYSFKKDAFHQKKRNNKRGTENKKRLFCNSALDRVHPEDSFYENDRRYNTPSLKRSDMQKRKPHDTQAKELYGFCKYTPKGLGCHGANKRRQSHSVSPWNDQTRCKLIRHTKARQNTIITRKTQGESHNAKRGYFFASNS